jgi:hypothetical protein
MLLGMRHECVWLLTAERGSTPLRDPGAPTNLLSPELTRTPGVLQTKQMNQPVIPPRQKVHQPHSELARERIPASRPSLGAFGSKTAGELPSVDGKNKGASQVQQYAPTLSCTRSVFF